MPQISRKTEKILLSYSPVTPYKENSEEWRELVDFGLASSPRKLSHNNICEWLLKEKSAASKKSVVSAFLIGLGLDLPQMRCALPAFSLSLNFSKHSFTPFSPESQSCSVCLLPEEKEVDFTFLQRCRWTGSLVGSSPLIQAAALYLQAHREELGYAEAPDENNLNLGVSIFKKIIIEIKKSPAEETPRTLAQRIHKTKLLKLNSETSRSFIDLLGYTGILQPPEHPSYLNEFITGIPPSKSHSSDWSYPVDFWTGKDGINNSALNFWFEDFL